MSNEYLNQAMKMLGMKLQRLADLPVEQLRGEALRVGTELREILVTEGLKKRKVLSEETKERMRAKRGKGKMVKRGK